MFTCTDNAAALIRSLIRDSDLPKGSGLRLILDATTRSLARSLAVGPHAADHVHIHGEVRIVVASSAVARLGQRTVHAQQTDRDRAFYLLDE